MSLLDVVKRVLPILTKREEMDYETAKSKLGHAILIGGGEFRRRAILFDVKDPDNDGVIWWQAVDHDEGHMMIQAGIDGQELLGPAPLEELLTHNNEHLRKLGLELQNGNTK